MSTRADILDDAKRIVTQDRAATHGNAENSFAAIAGHWTWWLQRKLAPGATITAYDVAEMMVGFKQARCMANPGHWDNHTDKCGYGALAGEIAAAEALGGAVEARSEPAGRVGAAEPPEGIRRSDPWEGA